MAAIQNPLIDNFDEAMLNLSINRMRVFLRLPNPRRVRVLAVVVLRLFVLLRHYGRRLERSPEGRRWFERRFLHAFELEGAVLRLANV